MRRRGLVLLCIGLSLFLFTGCQSKESKQVESMIAAIGDVTADSDAKLKEIESAYAALSEADAKQVKNADDLQKARETCDKEIEIKELKDSASVVVEKINGFKDITSDTELQSAINAAKYDYNKLNEEAKKYVDNYSLLEDAQKSLIDKQVTQTENLISGIGEVSLDSRESIINASKSYEALDSDAQQQVSNYSALQEAKNTYNELRKVKADEILLEFENKIDKIQNLEIYNCNHQIMELINKDPRGFISPTIAKTGNAFILHYALCNVSKDASLIYFNKVHVLADGQRFEKDIDYSEIASDYSNGYFLGGVEKDGQEDIEMLKAIADSKEAIIRFEGQNKWEDITVSDLEKECIKKAIEVYEAYEETL